MFTILMPKEDGVQLAKKLRLSFSYDNGGPVWVFNHIDIDPDSGEGKSVVVGVGAVAPPIVNETEDPYGSMMRVAFCNEFLGRTKTLKVILSLFTDPEYPATDAFKALADHMSGL